MNAFRTHRAAGELAQPVRSVVWCASSVCASSRAARSAWASAILLLLLSACGAKAPPAVEPKPPTPAPVIPIVVEPPAPTSWTMPAVVPSARYVSEVSAVLQHDTVGRVLEEHVETRAIITLDGRRDMMGSFQGSGVVDSFTVRGLEDLLTPRPGETSTTRTVPALAQEVLRVPFNIYLDDRRVRVSTRPPLANECDRAESGAINLVRDVVVRLPRTLKVGSTWQDSTVGFVCRLGIPITTRTKSSFLVERTEMVQNRTELIVRKLTDVQMTGELKSTWRTLSVNAVGSSTQTSRVDALTGLLQSADGDGVLTIKLMDTSRRDGTGAQEVRQRTIVKIRQR